MRELSLAGLLVGLAACQGAPPDTVQSPLDLTALQWLDSASDPVLHLTQHPSTCLTEPNLPAVQRGALLFESPTLLGGQAAKAGLSCAACHRNGRGNPDFVFPGISGPPGTADVTHGLFSKIRADQTFNPVPIPDLATSEGRSRVDRSGAGELESFLSAQIIEEFSGTAPENDVVSDLAAYIRALDDAVCDSTLNEPVSWQREIDLIRAGLARGAPKTPAYTNAMRAAAGRVFERFPGSENADLRQKLIAFSRALQAGASQDGFDADLFEIEAELAESAAGSFYDPEYLLRNWP